MSAPTLPAWAPAALSPTDVLAGDVYIASARYGLNDLTREQAIANARLIAAAPALAGAIQFVLADLNTTLDYEASLILRAALERAGVSAL